MPKVLLINPWIYDFAAYDFWIKPIGLLYIASVLRKNGFDVYFIDCLDTANFEAMDKKGIAKSNHKRHGSGHFFKENIETPEMLKTIPRKFSRYGITPDLLEEHLKTIPKPDVVLVTSIMTYWYLGVFQVVRMVKNYYPEAPLILGGIYATLCKDHASYKSGADFTFSGEGEVEIVKMVSEMTGHKISYLPDLDDLDSLPYPAFDLLYRHDSLCLLTGRGCPFDCTYCAWSMLHDTFRTRNPQRVVDEIGYWIERYQVKDFAFYDDALLYRPKDRIIPLLRGIIARDYNCNFHTPNGLHVREISKEVAELLMAAHFKTIRLGFETANVERQVKTGKKTTNLELKQAVNRLSQAGYKSDEIGVYLLAGLPGQCADEIRQSIQFVKDCGARPFLAEYSPIPGTALWQDAINKSKFDLSNEPLYHNNSILPCRLDGLSWEELYQLKQAIK